LPHIAPWHHFAVLLSVTTTRASFKRLGIITTTSDEAVARRGVSAAAEGLLEPGRESGRSRKLRRTGLVKIANITDLFFAVGTPHDLGCFMQNHAQ
jgi:hypothetical protein